MKALSIKEPWLSMIVDGRKTIETRAWQTSYRGNILLVGSKKPKGRFSGVAACIARLTDCRPMHVSDEDLAQCRVYAGAYSWVLENIVNVLPFAVQGRPGLYEVVELPIEVEHTMYKRLRPSLLRHYQGQFVGIYGGELVAVHADRKKLMNLIVTKRGHIRALIVSVTVENPRIMLPTSRKLGAYVEDRVDG